MVARTNNSQNQLTSVGQNALTYDNNGNTTTDDLGRTLIYDAWNRLISVNDSDGTLLNTYTYDGLNHRITEAPYDLVTDLYYSAQWQVIEEHSNGNWKYQYVWSPVYVNAMVSRNELGFGRTYALQDANYNTTALVGARWMLEPELYPDIPNGWQVVERFVYNSYGQMTVFVRGYLSNTFVQANDNNHWNYTFQGMRYDPMTELLFSQTRPYDPDLGIWISQDIFYFDGPNLYAFVICNPINGLDPSGYARVIIAFDGLGNWKKNNLVPGKRGDNVTILNLLQAAGVYTYNDRAFDQDKGTKLFYSNNSWGFGNGGAEQTVIDALIKGKWLEPYFSKSKQRCVYHTFVVVGHSLGGGSAWAFTQLFKAKFGDKVNLGFTVDPRNQLDNGGNARDKNPLTALAPWQLPGQNTSAAARWVNFYQKTDWPMQGYDLPVGTDGFSAKIDNADLGAVTHDGLITRKSVVTAFRLEIGKVPYSQDSLPK